MCSICSSTSNLSLSSSIPITSKTNICLLGHLCPGVNFSGHQKHSPLALFASISLLDICLVFCSFLVAGGAGNKGKWVTFTGGFT
ncbi:hypothetical protein Hanom_Chr02g00175021 [Helianthus anomalus]